MKLNLRPPFPLCFPRPSVVALVLLSFHVPPCDGVALDLGLFTGIGSILRGSAAWGEVGVGAAKILTDAVIATFSGAVDIVFGRIGQKIPGLITYLFPWCKCRNYGAPHSACCFFFHACCPKQLNSSLVKLFVVDHAGNPVTIPMGLINAMFGGGGGGASGGGGGGYCPPGGVPPFFPFPPHPSLNCTVIPPPPPPPPPYYPPPPPPLHPYPPPPFAPPPPPQVVVTNVPIEFPPIRFKPITFPPIEIPPIRVPPINMSTITVNCCPPGYPFAPPPPSPPPGGSSAPRGRRRSVREAGEDAPPGGGSFPYPEEGAGPGNGDDVAYDDDATLIAEPELGGAADVDERLPQLVIATRGEIDAQ